MSLQIVMTHGVQNIGCNDWKLVVSLIVNHFRGKEDFISFKNIYGKTVITNGNGEEEGHLVTVDRSLFSKEVWAVYGNDGEVQYYTFMLPSEY